jgi:hypothetical protein
MDINHSYMNTRLLPGFIIGVAVTLAAVDMAAQDQEVVEIRSARPGQWNDPDIWERFNGSQWTPLLPNQYPGCKALRYAHVSVEHKVYLPLGLDIHVAEVTAAREEFLLVDGALTTDIARNEVDPPVSEVLSPGIPAPGGESGITVAPNPLLMARGGDRVMVGFSVAEEHLSVRLRLYNESGNVVRQLREWDRLAPGSYNVDAVLSDLPSGTYHLALETPGMRRTEALTIVK